MTVAPLNPPERLLCGPGPANISPAVQDAMQRPLLGHMDPDLADINAEVVELLRAAYQAPDAAIVLPLQATGTSGMEAGLAHLLEPGDTAIIGVNGFFGRRIVEIATRVGAEVVPVEADWGQPVANDDLHGRARGTPGRPADDRRARRDLERGPASAQRAGRAVRDRDVLLMADCVTSLGGVELAFDAWGVDFAYSCTQKCVGAPPGMSPLAVSERALERIGKRTHPVPYSYDLQLLQDYWVKRPPVYHNTVPVLGIYALHEALRDVASEGSERPLGASRPGRHGTPDRAALTRPGAPHELRAPAAAADRRARPRRRRCQAGADRNAARARDRDRRRAGAVGALDVAHRADGPQRHRRGGRTRA